MFAYCGNNPVMYRDDFGKSPSQVMVALYDVGGSTSYDGARVSRYISSIGCVLVFDGRTISQKEMEKQAQKHPNCIIVYDARYCSKDCDGKCNPNMQIYNSYQITDAKQQKEILEILYNHDKKKTSRHSWGRTVDSMLVEWEMHNNHYYSQIFHWFDKVFGMQTCISAKHVDFDKESEGLSIIQLYIKAL